MDCKWSQRSDLNRRPTDYEFLATVPVALSSQRNPNSRTRRKGGFRSESGNRRQLTVRQ